MRGRIAAALLLLASIALPAVSAMSNTVASDVNGDGRSDILYRNVTTGQLYRLLMNGFAIENGAFFYDEPDLDWKVRAEGDFDNDGVMDLAWRKLYTSADTFLMYMGSSGQPVGGVFTFMKPPIPWTIVATADLDGDGRSDLLWRDPSTGYVVGIVVRAGGLTPPQPMFGYYEPNPDWHIVGTGDFAGSGKRNQILWQNVTTGQVWLMTVSWDGTLNPDAMTQTGTMIYRELDTAWKIVATGDFDGDGKTDILWHNDATGQVFLMLMNNGAIAHANQVYVEPNLDWKIVAVGDYDGDGKSDILWRNDTTGQLYMMLMDGMHIHDGAFVYTEANPDWHVLGPAEYAQ